MELSTHALIEKDRNRGSGKWELKEETETRFQSVYRVKTLKKNLTITLRNNHSVTSLNAMQIIFKQPQLFSILKKIYSNPYNKFYRSYNFDT